MLVCSHYNWTSLSSQLLRDRFVAGSAEQLSSALVIDAQLGCQGRSVEREGFVHHPQHGLPHRSGHRQWLTKMEVIRNSDSAGVGLDVVAFHLHLIGPVPSISFSCLIVKR